MMQYAEVSGQSLNVVLPYAARSGGIEHGTVEVRRLQGEDEALLEEFLASGRSAAAAASLLIGRCASNDSGALGPDAARRLTLGDREVALRAIYAESFAPNFAARITCPHCGEAIELDVHLAELAKPPPEAGPYHRISVGTDEVGCRVPTGDDLEHALLMENATMALAHACAGTAPVDPETLSRELLRLDPNAECVLGLACPECGARFSGYLDAFELIRAALAEAGGILRQVDSLARRYGWSERDILQLPRSRRLRYCALAGGAA